MGVEGREELIPIVFFIIVWIIYIDMFYASMASPLLWEFPQSFRTIHLIVK